MLCFTVAQHVMIMDSPINCKHEFVNNGRSFIRKILLRKPTKH